MKGLFVPVDTLQSFLHPDLEDGFRFTRAVLVQEPHEFVEDEIRLRHDLVGFSDHRFLADVSLTEALKLIGSDGELASVTEGFGRVILLWHYQDLVAFPTERLESLDLLVHVLLVVEAANNGVDLKFDAVAVAPGGNLI